MVQRGLPVLYRSEVPPIQAVWDLFLTTGWNEEYKISILEYGRVLTASDLFEAAWSGEKLVGFGRAVSDTLLHAMVYDLIVHPAWQAEGIGTHLLESLVNRLRAEGIRDIQLFCARGKRPFYERCGFAARPDDGPGMYYVGIPKI